MVGDVGATAVRPTYALAALIVGCQCFVPVDEEPDGGRDAGDAGPLARCAATFSVVPEQRLASDNYPGVPGEDGFGWYSKERREGCVVYSFGFGLLFITQDPASWNAFTHARVCNACEVPVTVATTYHGDLNHRDNRLGYYKPEIAPEPEHGFSGADLGVALRDSRGETVPSFCVSQKDVWCAGIHEAAPGGDAGSPDLRVRSVELMPGETLGLAGLTHLGVSESDARLGGDLVADVAPFEDWRGYLFGSSAPQARIDLDGALDLVAFLPRAVPTRQAGRLRPAKPRDQACAHYGFPLVAAYCRERLDAGSYTREDFVEVAIPNIELPARLLEVLKERASRPLPDGG